jgi:hypothetical protein
LLLLFGSAQRALTFIKKYKSDTSQQPIHDLWLFQLPMNFSWCQNVWASLALQYGTEVTLFLHWASRIESLLQRAPINLEEIKTIAQQIQYYRESENPTLAALFSKYKISEPAFNRVLNHFHPKLTDNIPDCWIEGDTFGEPRFYLKKLPANDLRGFVLGAMTHCCQSVGSAGEACAIHGMESVYGGFYAVFKRPSEKMLKKEKSIVALAEEAKTLDAFLNQFKIKAQQEKYSKIAASVNHDLSLLRIKLCHEYSHFEEGEMVAQLWAWLSQDNALVLDSWERLRPEDNRLCQPFLERLATLVLKKTQVPRVLLGRGGQTPEFHYTLVKTPEQPKDYYDYRDSREQYLIASRGKEEVLSVPMAIETEIVKRSSNTADYQSQEMYALISCYFLKQKNVMVLLPVDLNREDCQEKIMGELNRFTEYQTANSEKRSCGILTLLTKEKHWTALVIECSHSKSPHQAKQFSTLMTYLDFSGHSMPNELRQVLNRSEFKQHHVIQTCPLIYNEKAMFSGAWLLEILRRYAEKPVLSIYPIAHMHAVTTAQEKLLKCIQMHNASDNWGVFRTKEMTNYAFTFFAAKEAAAIKCVSRDCYALQTEVEREQERLQRFF